MPADTALICRHCRQLIEPEEDALEVTPVDGGEVFHVHRPNHDAGRCWREAVGPRSVHAIAAVVPNTATTFPPRSK